MTQFFKKILNFLKCFAFRGKIDFDVHIGENCVIAQKFRPIHATFREMLAEENEGLALAVLVDGVLVVDLWGGYADRSVGRFWEVDTITCMYSVSKFFGALVIGALNSRGLLKYEDLVAKHWPRFAQNGKETLTTDDILMHKAGLVAFHRDILLEEAEVFETISTVIEKSVPLWALGTGKSSYHAFTWGFLVDEIVRRVDSRGRNVCEFLKQEISTHISDEFYIGLPEDQFHRATRQTQLTTWQKILAIVRAPMSYLTFAIFEKFLAHPLYEATKTAIGFFRLDKENNYPYNNQEVVAVRNVGVLGFGTARGIAKTAWHFFQKNDLLSEEVKNLIKAPTEKVRDVAIPVTSYRGHGFNYITHPIHRDQFIIIAEGYGGQFVDLDMESKMVTVLLRNCIKPPQDPANKLQYEKLRKQIFEIVYNV